MPYANDARRVPAGMAVEMGDNRVELALQTRDPAIDSDLAWRDAGVLAAGPARPGSGVLVRPRVVPGLVQPETDVPWRATCAPDPACASIAARRAT